MNAAEAGLVAVVLVAALVQATTGIGFALILAPLVAAVRPDLLPGTLILLMIPLNAWVAWRERHAIDLHGTGWITAGRAAGAVAALGILAILSLRGLNILIGLSTALAVAASWAAPRFRPDRVAFLLAGLVTGVTETTTGIGGPPLALVFQHRSPPELRANVALCFLVGEVMSVVLLVPAGLLGPAQVAAALAALPALALGIALSGPLHHRLDARRLRVLVLGFALVSALAILARAL